MFYSLQFNRLLNVAQSEDGVALESKRKQLHCPW